LLTRRQRQMCIRDSTDAESQNIPLTEIKAKVIAAVQAAKQSIA
jgi:hypothetical protein